MKKIISLLVAVLLVACLVPAAFAAGSASLYMTTGEDADHYFQKGDVITVSLRSADTFGPADLYGFTYNAEALEVSNFQIAQLSTEPFVCLAAVYNPANNGQVNVMMAKNFSGDRAICTFQVKVLAEQGEFTIEFKSNDSTVADADTASKMSATVAPLTIKVGKPHEHKAAKTEIENKVEATCTKAGSYDEVVYCECGHEISRKTITIDMLPHTEEVVKGYPATCTKTGLTDGLKCSVCGTVLKAQEEIAKVPHTVEVIKGYAATCTKTGLTDGEKCSVCGEILKAQEEIAMLPHTWGADVAVGPYDCDKGSETTHTCSVCGATEAGAKIEPHKHETYAVPQGDSYEKDGKIYQDYIDYCRHGDKDNKAAHGCSFKSEQYPKEIGEEPPMGDITPYITMGVVTVVALVSAAAYLFLKRKAI